MSNATQVSSKDRISYDAAVKLPEVEDVRADLHALRADFGRLVDSLMADGKRKLSDVAEGLGETAKHSLETTEKKIQSRPLLSVIVMFLAGLLLGRLVLRA